MCVCVCVCVCVCTFILLVKQNVIIKARLYYGLSQRGRLFLGPSLCLGGP